MRVVPAWLTPCYDALGRGHSSRGAAGVPSKQGGVEACLVWILSQVGGGVGGAQLAPPQQLRGWPAGVTPSLLAPLNGKLGLEN